MKKAKDIIHLPATLEGKLRKEMNEGVFASADVKYDNIFFVIPNDEEKTLIISPSSLDSVLKLGIKEAEALAAVIQSQIQEWK